MLQAMVSFRGTRRRRAVRRPAPHGLPAPRRPRQVADLPHLRAGVGLLRGDGIALIGGHDKVADRIAGYRALGIDEFILSGWPHDKQATLAAGTWSPRSVGEAC